MVSTFAPNILIDDRAVDMLFLGEDIRDIDRFRASISALLFVCERALFGIVGASSLEALCLDGVPK